MLKKFILFSLILQHTLLTAGDKKTCDKATEQKILEWHKNVPQHAPQQMDFEAPLSTIPPEQPAQVDLSRIKDPNFMHKLATIMLYGDDKDKVKE